MIRLNRKADKMPDWWHQTSQTTDKFYEFDRFCFEWLLQNGGGGEYRPDEEMVFLRRSCIEIAPCYGVHFPAPRLTKSHTNQKVRSTHFYTFLYGVHVKSLPGCQWYVTSLFLTLTLLQWNSLHLRLLVWNLTVKRRKKGQRTFQGSLHSFLLLAMNGREQTGDLAKLINFYFAPIN